MDKEKNIFALISGRASVTKTLDLGSISCLTFSNKKRQREDSIVCGRQVDKTWQLNSKTKKGSFAVSWRKQLGKCNKITKIIGHW